MTDFVSTVSILQHYFWAAVGADFENEILFETRHKLAKVGAGAEVIFMQKTAKKGPRPAHVAYKATHNLQIARLIS